MVWLRPSRPAALLGLVIEDDTILATVDRADASPPPSPLRLPGALDRDDPVALGRTLRRALRAAGWKAERCAVGLPAEWCLALTSITPDLSPEDLEAFLALEAERELPSEPVDWVIGRCSTTEPSGRHVLQVALGRARLARIEVMLRAAGLRPTLITATLAAAAIALPRPAIVVRQGRCGGAICLAAQSGVVTLRSIGTADDSFADLARELRITRESQSGFPAEAPARLLVVTHAPPAGADGDAGATAAFGRAASVEVHSDDHLPGLLLDAVRANPSSLPSLRSPTPTRWSAALLQSASRRVRTLALAAAAALAIVATAFAWREIQLQALRHDWSTLQAEVQRLNDVQSRLREFRAWDDPSLPSLALLRLVAEAFPESGVVTARSVELRPPQTITVSGTAREHGALLATVDRLRQQPAVRSVRVEQIRGQNPAQFTFAVELNRSPSP